MRTTTLYCLSIVSIVLAWSTPALAAAQDQDQGTNQGQVEVQSLSLSTGQSLRPIEVISVTPLHGTGLSKSKFPANIQTVNGEQLDKSNSADLPQYLNEHLGSVFLNESQDNPLQPNLSYRGYTVSPLLGLPQGLAVYQDGVRINEPFGDTVNFSLIPKSAISSVQLTPGADPVFGRNALGGALSIQTKSGLSAPGIAGQAYYGSFDRRFVQGQIGGQKDQFDYFLTGSYFDEDGWRDFSPSRDGNLFGKLGWHDATSRLSLSINYAKTDLIGNGTTPLQLLNKDRSAIFTRPDQTKSDLLMFNLKGNHQFSDNVLISGNTYFRRNDIDTRNGDDSDFDECAGNSAFLCADDGDGNTVVDTQGNAVQATDAVESGTNNTTSTDQDGYGASAQLTFSNAIFNTENQFVLGGAFDGSNVDYNAQTELARLDFTRLAVGSGITDRSSLVNAGITSRSYGLYFTDTWTPIKPLSLTLAGRYNRNHIDINDHRGSALDGEHTFNHFNPAVGATYRFMPALSAYARYSISNRFPVASELTCANPSAPCRLPNDFVSDPNLHQVVAKSTEAGLRGHFWSTHWTLALFHSVNHHDIQFISAGQLQNTGYFRNVGDTRRQGIELTLNGQVQRLKWFLSYTFLDATFRHPFTVRSPNNPKADSNDDIHVESGDRIPSIPRHELKLGGDYSFTDSFDLGATLRYRSDQYLQGDQSNQNRTLGSYVVVNMQGNYKVSKHVTLFARIDNVFDNDYSTYGTFAEADEVLGSSFDNPRAYSPGAPRAGWFGVKVHL